MALAQIDAVRVSVELRGPLRARTSSPRPPASCQSRHQLLVFPRFRAYRHRGDRAARPCRKLPDRLSCSCALLGESGTTRTLPLQHRQLGLPIKHCHCTLATLSADTSNTSGGSIAHPPARNHGKSAPSMRVAKSRGCQGPTPDVGSRSAGTLRHMTFLERKPAQANGNFSSMPAATARGAVSRVLREFSRGNAKHTSAPALTVACCR